MRKASSIFKPDAPAKKAEEENKGHGWKCFVDGCRLPGSMSDSTKGGPFHCWAHDRANNRTNWGLLTVAINENIWLYRVAEKVANMPLDDLEKKEPEVNNYLKAQGREDLCRIQKNTGEWSDRCDIEPRSFWVSRLRNAAWKTRLDNSEYANSSSRYGE